MLFDCGGLLNPFNTVTKLISAIIGPRSPISFNELLVKPQTSFLTKCAQSIVEVAKRAA